MSVYRKEASEMKTNLGALVILALLLCASSHLHGRQLPLYKDSGAPVEKRVGDLLARMTLEEKIDMLGGVESFYIRPNERLGIPKIKMADGPLGVRNYGKATAFPAGIAFAATWNRDLTKRMGEMVGKEARSKGVHIMLSPGVNIYRAPMCGRNFEYYGEDPYLASRMVIAYVEGVQSHGVVATVKHYAANNQEYERHRVSSEVDERTLREIYLPTFRAAVEEAHVGAVMNSYNLVNGIHSSQHRHLLTEILKGDWKFDGLVMSDWSSTYDGVAAANGGLDLEMPSGEHMNRDTLLPAIQAGKVAVTTIDDKVRRMLRVMFRFGFFDREQADLSLPLYNPDSRLVALEAAREGIVLLKNKGNILPLDRKEISTIAVIGPAAHPAVTGGGGSSRVQPFRSVSALEGIIAGAGNVIKVLYSPGVGSDFAEAFRTSEFVTLSATGQIVRGLKGEFFSNRDLSGAPALSRIDRRINFIWGESAPAGELSADDFSVRWTGKVRIESEGEYEFIVKGDDGYRLYVDNRLVIDSWQDQAATVKTAALALTAGTMPDIKLEYYEHGGDAEISLGWRKRIGPKDADAVKLAARADVAIVCVGFNSETEGEGFDRPFEISKEQEELIREVARVNKRTIVVVTAGGNVSMSGWLDDVAGLMHAWYPGQEGGTAISEILFGDVNPSGKLPVSFEKRWEDNATYHSYYDDDKDLKVTYSEGVFLGYRHFDKENLEPMFPFGFGLSYTTFSYENLKTTPQNLRRGGKISVSLDVTNTGNYAGAEVVQVYVRDIESSVPRPVKELKGFEKIQLKPGETKPVRIELDESALSFYDPSKKAWVAEPGAFEVLVGSSSRDIRLKERFELLK
jgi:beta-glucosidase